MHKKLEEKSSDWVRYVLYWYLLSEMQPQQIKLWINVDCYIFAIYLTNYIFIKIILQNVYPVRILS